MIKDDLAYIDHILDCIRKINEFSHGLTLKFFLTSALGRPKLFIIHYRRFPAYRQVGNRRIEILLFLGL